MPEDITPRHYRVPRDDHSLLAIPGLTAAPELVDQNRTLFSTSICLMHGRALSELRELTRREAFTAARDYTASMTGSQVAGSVPQSFVVTGHQPELFHVGVWAKNFALAGLARRCNAQAINLIIDNDTLNGTSLRIPVGSREVPTLEHCSFDVSRPAQPWEEARIRDYTMFREFGSRVRNRIQENWGFDPVVGQEWDSATKRITDSDRLCDGLTAFRMHLERRWGQTNLELPMSRLCETEPFLWFAAHLLMRLPEFHVIYNETVANYRRLHRLRNRMQPVPDLESSDGWLEAPFWIWQRDALQRGRLFARRLGSFCELRDEKSIFARLPLINYGSLSSAVAILSELPARGYRLRTRALTTTLFARVCLADVFVHGIGGAKYDAMTDQLCERLFGLKAPDFQTISATLFMPLGGPFSATEIELTEINHKLRDLIYNPDRHVKDLPKTKALIDEKSELQANAQQMRASNQLRGHLTRDQHRRLCQIRLELQVFTTALRKEYQSQRQTLVSQLSANTLLRNREFSFALYPEERVQEFLLPVSELTVPNVQ